jgi:hypothetical protein
MSSSGASTSPPAESLITRLERRATIRRRPYWTTVRSASNTVAVRASILIPLVGYWIILNAKIVSEIADLSQDYSTKPRRRFMHLGASLLPTLAFVR